MAEPEEKPITKYLEMVSQYDAEFKKWETRADKIIRKYRDDERGFTNNETAKFNILWSNVQTLTPACYAKMPKADVSRRFGDNDQVGRVASLLIERALDFEIEHYPDFRAAMTNVVQDRFLGGRGTAWVRYEPHVRAQQGEPDDGLQITEDTDEAENETGGPDEVQEEIDYECAPTDYVHWKDFGHSSARTWEEVTAVWRWVYLTKDAVDDRFGEGTSETIEMDSAPEGLTGSGAKNRKKDMARVCEFWDKDKAKVYWFVEGAEKFLDERDDPLDLEGFFPCGQPLFATLTSDSLVPVPDYVLYQDQANELDILSDRIDGLVKALRVRGVYDASQPALQRLLTEGDNNTLIPVDRWAALAEKGGLKGSIDLLPIDTIAAALIQCYQAVKEIKGIIYEITGISDIIRGQSVASETATAQHIKGQYAGLRLSSMQQGVALFATSLLRLKAQIICGKFQAETILMYAAAEQLSDSDKALVPQALQLLIDNPLRNFRIEVATDSLVQLDEAEVKKSRLEFLTAFGGFMREALPAAQAQPKLQSMLLEVLRFGMSAFKGGRQIEGTIDTALTALKQSEQQAAMNPQPPKPTPEEMAHQGDMMRAQASAQAAQADAQIKQGQLQLDQQRLQIEAQTAQAEAQAKAADAQREMEIEKGKYNIEIEKLRIEREKIAADIEIERNKITANNDLEMAKLSLQLQHEAGIERAKLDHEAGLAQFQAKAQADQAEKVAATPIT